MSEMLGNQYFMARNFRDAVKEFEPIYLKAPSNKSIRRKLIIGYTQIGKLKKALELFVELVKEDVEFIINTDPVFDDCPCSEIIEKKPYFPEEKLSSETNIYSGILWLYCDPKLSVDFLKKVKIDLPEMTELDEVIKIIEKYINNPSKNFKAI
jgi:pentatricopeptide repeat protein